MCFLRNGSSYSFETCTIAIVHAWKPQGVYEFGTLNTKESDVLAQNVFSQKQVIIQLWILYHSNQHTGKPQGALSLALQIQKKVMF